MSLQTHDQVGNRATGDRLSASVSPGLLACGAALLLTSAGTPMLFMGEEWGATTPWQYFTDHTDPAIAAAVSEGRRNEFASHGWQKSDVPDPQAPETFERSKLDWSQPAQEPHAALLRWYTDLIALRREIPDLGDPRLDRLQVDHDADRQTVTVRRGDHRVLVNLSDETRDLLVAEPGSDYEPAVVAAWQPDETTLLGEVLSLPAESAAVVRVSPVG
jgi:maltooligosyltrehalose trehalohydrolase